MGKPQQVAGYQTQSGMINYENIENLDAFELAEIRKYSEKAYNRASRGFKEAEMKVGIKVSGKGGKKKRYTINVKLFAPHLITSVEQSDWDLQRTLNKVFMNLGNSLAKILKKESAKHKPKKFFRE